MTWLDNAFWFGLGVMVCYMALDIIQQGRELDATLKLWEREHQEFVARQKWLDRKAERERRVAS